jgi:hypothetical protein
MCCSPVTKLRARSGFVAIDRQPWANRSPGCSGKFTPGSADAGPAPDKASQADAVAATARRLRVRGRIIGSTSFPDGIGFAAEAYIVVPTG